MRVSQKTLKVRKAFTLSGISSVTPILAGVSMLGWSEQSKAANESATWNGTGAAISTAANWSPSTAVPNGTGIGTFDNTGAANSTVTVDANRNIRMQFTGSNSYSFNGGSFAITGGATLAEMLAASTANQTINSNVFGGGAGLNFTGYIRNQSTSNTLTINGAIGGNNTTANLSYFFTTQAAKVGNKIVLGGTISDILTVAGKTGSGNLAILKTQGSGDLGNLTLNGNNSYTGGTDYNAGSGSFTLGHKNALGTGTVRINGSGIVIDANTNLSGANAIANTIRLNGPLTGITGNTDITGMTVGSNIVTVSEATGLTVGSVLNYQSGAGRPFAIGTYITAISGSSGSQTVTLSTAVATGGTTTNISSGTNRFQSVGSGSSTHTFAGSNNIEFSGTVYLGSGYSTAGTAVQTFNVTNSGITTFSGSLIEENSIKGTGLVVGALTKTGTGKLVLSGSNSYTGSTTVNANSGTLLINGNSSSATGAVTINTGSTLGGVGTVGGNISMLAGSTLTPSESNSVGKLTAAKNVTLAGSYEWEFDNAGAVGIGGTNFDQLAMTGASSTLALGGALDIELTSGNYSTAFWNSPRSFKIIDVTNSAGTSGSIGTINATGITGEGTFSTAIGTGANAGDVLLNWTPSSVMSISLTGSADFANVATGSQLTVTGSNGKYVSEIDELTSASVVQGSLPVVSIGNEAPATDYVMLWIDGNSSDTTGWNLNGGTVVTSGAEYDKLMSAYTGWDVLISYANFSGSKNVNFDFTGSGITIDKIAVVPEPSALGVLALAGAMVAGRRRRRA